MKQFDLSAQNAAFAILPCYNPFFPLLQSKEGYLYRSLSHFFSPRASQCLEIVHLCSQVLLHISKTPHMHTKSLYNCAYSHMEIDKMLLNIPISQHWSRKEM